MAHCLFFRLLAIASEEKDAAMRFMLRQRISLHTHVFQDSLLVYEDEDAHHQIYSQPDFESKILKAFDLKRSVVQYCETHNDDCPIETNAASRVIGWPCQDYSKAGNKRGVYGKQFPVACSAAARASVANNALVSIECTENMPEDLPLQTFGPSWGPWHSCLLEPSQAGFEFVARKRLDKYELFLFVFFQFLLVELVKLTLLLLLLLCL